MRVSKFAILLSNINEITIKRGYRLSHDFSIFEIIYNIFISIEFILSFQLVNSVVFVYYTS